MGDGNGVSMYCILIFRMAPEKVCLIIGACAVLHNIAVLLNEPMDDADLPDEVPEVEVYDGPQQGLTIRNRIYNIFWLDLCTYFFDRA